MFRWFCVKLPAGGIVLGTGGPRRACAAAGRLRAQRRPVPLRRVQMSAPIGRLIWLITLGEL